MLCKVKKGSVFKGESFLLLERTGALLDLSTISSSIQKKNQNTIKHSKFS